MSKKKKPVKIPMKVKRSREDVKYIPPKLMRDDKLLTLMDKYKRKDVVPASVYEIGQMVVVEDQRGKIVAKEWGPDNPKLKIPASGWLYCVMLERGDSCYWFQEEKLFNE